MRYKSRHWSPNCEALCEKEAWKNCLVVTKGLKVEEQSKVMGHYGLIALHEGQRKDRSLDDSLKKAMSEAKIRRMDVILDG